MKTYMKVSITLFVLLFLMTGTVIIVVSALPNSSWGAVLALFITAIFTAHMFCWMVLGMMANYLWDLFRAKKGLADINLPDVLLPLLVSPIVFFGIWSFWPDREINFALDLVAFQNGFFWQAILSKAGPVTKV